MFFEIIGAHFAMRLLGKRVHFPALPRIQAAYMTFSPLKLFSMTGKIKILHYSWMAFFISFVVWFNHAPLLVFIRQEMGLSDSQVETILLLNVALTIPARVVVGMFVDRFGARLSYSLLLAISSLPCFAFAVSDTFAQLAWSRFLLGFVGAGFVVGVRIIGDWFPSYQIGAAEGIYAGWGNFGAAFAAFVLPGMVMYFGEADGWRYAVAITGMLSLIGGFFYYRGVDNFPPQLTDLKTRQAGSMEVSSIGDLFLYMLSLIPLYAALSVLIGKLSRPPEALLDGTWEISLNIIVWLVFFIHAYKLVNANQERLSRPVPLIYQYRYRQVFLLAVAYLISFGSKLAVLSILPMHFFNTFHITRQLSMVDAGMLAALFVATNVLARPFGGWMSDKIGRKLTLVIFSLGLSAGYGLMSRIDSDWSLLAAVAATLVCAVFIQAAEGAIFAFVPLVRSAITGEVAGIVGAYGNAGAIFFLILLTLMPPEYFFLVLACCGLLQLLLICFLAEPRNYISEIMPDGRVVKIDLE